VSVRRICNSVCLFLIRGTLVVCPEEEEEDAANGIGTAAAAGAVPAFKGCSRKNRTKFAL